MVRSSEETGPEVATGSSGTGWCSDFRYGRALFSDEWRLYDDANIRWRYGCKLSHRVV
jgi:hypothetical protein